MTTESGFTGTTENSFSIGDGLDGYKHLYANDTSSPQAGIRWNPDAIQWEFSNDGVTWSVIGAGSGSIPDHNDLTNIDGGAAAEYFHFTTDEHTWLTDGYADGYWGEIKGGTGQSFYTTGDILYASAANTLSKLAVGTNTHVLTLSGGVPIWQASTGLVETATDNVAGGTGALVSHTTGDYNTAFGINALPVVSSGSYNVGFGYNAGTGVSGSYNVHIGDNTGFTASTSLYNIAIGNKALYLNTSGGYNVALGASAGYGVDPGTGANNVFIGKEAARHFVGTSKNLIAIGEKAGDFSSGQHCIYMGYLSAQYLRGDSNYNVGIGYQALHGSNVGVGTTSGDRNIGIGYNCLFLIGGSSVTPSDNIAIGTETLNSLTSADNNIAIGYYAGETISTGNDNICIGYNSDVLNTNTEGIAIGKTVLANADNCVVIGSTYTSTDANATTLTYYDLHIGAAGDSDVIIYANTDNAPDGYIKYDNTLSKWVGSDDGLAIYDLNSSSGGYPDTLYKDTTPILYTTDSPVPFNDITVICDGYFAFEEDFPLPVILVAPSSSHDGIGLLIMGQNDYTGTYVGGNINIQSGDGYAAGDIIIKAGDNNQGNILLNGNVSTNMQSAQGAIYIKDGDAIPTGNPTEGGYLYSESGSLKWRGSSGTVTIIAPA